MNLEKWLSLWSIGQEATKEDIEKIKEAGFTGVEIWAEHSCADDYLTYAKDCGLDIGLHLPFHDLNLATPFEEVKDKIFAVNLEWFKKMAEIGGGHAVIHGGAAWASEDREESMERVIERLKELNEIAVQHKVELLFENQIPDKLNYTHIFPSSVEEWLHILQETGASACLDTGHLAVLGDSLEETIEKLGSKLVSVHHSDNDALADLHLLPGDGENVADDLMEILQKNGYEGPLVFEINPYKYSLQQILEHPSVRNFI